MHDEEPDDRLQDHRDDRQGPGDLIFELGEQRFRRDGDAIDIDGIERRQIHATRQQDEIDQVRAQDATEEYRRAPRRGRSDCASFAIASETGG